jgi:Putative beta-lactamase-inhibitor-like, PepSY-like
LIVKKIKNNIMKKSVFFVFGLMLFFSFSSCEKDESPILTNQEELLIQQITSAQNIETLESSVLSANIRNYVENNYSPFEIELVFHAPQLGYEVMLENGLCLFFDENTQHLNHDGMHTDWDNHHNNGYYCLTGDTLSNDAVPQNILDFLAANYSGNNIANVVLKPSGKLFIELDDGKILFFNPFGDFLQECDIINGQGESNHSHHHFNFGDYSWHCDGDGMDGHGGMGGHHEENWEGPCWGGTGIAVENLPTVISEYINAHHANATIEFAMHTYSNNYFLRLSDCTRIVFDHDGTVLFDSGG